MQLELTPSQLMALTDLVLESILCRASTQRMDHLETRQASRHAEVYVDVVRQVETAPEELLELLCKAGGQR